MEMVGWLVGWLVS